MVGMCSLMCLICLISGLSTMRACWNYTLHLPCTIHHGCNILDNESNTSKVTLSTRRAFLALQLIMLEMCDVCVCLSLSQHQSLQWVLFLTPLWGTFCCHLLSSIDREMCEALVPVCHICLRFVRPEDRNSPTKSL